VKAVYKIETRKPTPATNENDPSGVSGLIRAFPGGFVPAER
jgi:hypothetical protein